MTSLRLPHYFSLGIRGFVGGLLWLGPPTTLLVLGHQYPLLGWLGGFALVGVVMMLPLLQVQMAADNRFASMFAVSSVRKAYTHDPLMCGMAITATLVLAVPLYLMKIELVPREAAWLPSLLFVLFVYPARIVSGWALARARKQPAPRHWTLRWGGRALLLPIAAGYVAIVFSTQYLSWYGVWSLYEQHAFLVPVPFW